MPILAVNMAQPWNDPNRVSQVYILPTDEEPVNRTVNIHKRKYVFIKMIELLLTTIALVFFVLGIAATQNTIREMLISVSFGAFIIYPFVFVMLNFRLKNNKGLITLNILITVFSILIGSLIIFSSWNVEVDLDKVEETNKEIFLKAQFVSNMRLCSALTCLVNGILYLSESILFIFETKVYV